jgi:predicted nuclease of predicted toxin-antitoxin system
MRLLLDMNLSPDLCRSLAALGHEAVHWSNVGEPTAADEVVMTYARDRGFVVVSHDLDFSAMLAATHARQPSVVQLRSQDVMGETFLALLSATLRTFQRELSTGALIVVDESRSRVRLLPIGG